MTRERLPIPDGLEGRIYETIVAFPDRIDQMETRSEDACRRLARRIAILVRETGPSAHGATAGPVRR